MCNHYVKHEALRQKKAAGKGLGNICPRNSTIPTERRCKHVLAGVVLYRGPRTIEREIGLRVERQLIERFLDYGGVMVLDVQYRFLFPVVG